MTVTSPSTPTTAPAPGARPPAPVRWLRWGGSAGVLVVAALAFVAVMPRGPVAERHVPLAMGGAVLTGMAVGWLARSRWAMALAPTLFALVVEVARVGVVGPSVDWPRLDSQIGIAVAVTGRGVAAWLLLVPMALGAALGAALWRRRSGITTAATGWHRFWLWTRRAATVVLAALLALTAVGLSRPGTTAPFVDATGAPVPGSVAELVRLPIGGTQQTVMLRGRSADAPVLLYLAGGPGQSDIGYARAYLSGLEDDVVLAVWDQRGTGTSYDALDPTDTWTLDRAVSDTVEVATYLRDRFGGRKVVLFGNSWGSILGVLAVQRRPDLFAAFVGAGQMVSPLETDRRLNEDARALAAARGDAALAARIDSWGPPPYADAYPYAELIALYSDIEPYQMTESFQAGRPSGIDGNGADEYGWLDKLNKLRAIADMGAVMYPQVQGVDFRRDVPALDVPVYVVAGAHELSARADLAQEWFADLAAPVKEWIVFEGSGHVPQFEEAERFEQVIREVVLPGIA